MGFLSTTDKIFSILWKVALLVVIVLGVLYFGACIHLNFFDKTDVSGYELPKAPTDAQYKIVIVNSGNVLYTNSYVMVGERVILNGYWEVAGRRYVYRKNVVTLDPATFGPIMIIPLR